MTSTSVTKGSVVNFNLSPEDIEKMVERMIREEHDLYNKVASVETPTFSNVIVPLNKLYNSNEVGFLSSCFLRHVSTNKDVRDAGEKARKLWSELEIEFSSREDVYQAVLKVYNNKKEMDALTQEDKRLVEMMILNYRRFGLMLPQEKREQLHKLKGQLFDLEVAFSRNLNNSNGVALFTREELDGMPDDYFDERNTEVVDGVTKYVVTTKYPDYYPLLRYAKLENTRKTLFVVNNTRCPDNIQLLQDAVKIRQEKAKLMEYKTHSEFVLEPLMAKTPLTVLKMENDLRNKLVRIGIDNLSELEALKKADMKKTGKPYDGFFQWDLSYYMNLANEQKHDLSENDIKKYFPLANVLRGIFDIYQNMLSLRIVKIENAPVWHSSVEMFEVWEANEDKFVGHFYLDLYPREGKYNRVGVSRIRPGYEHDDGTREYPVTAMMANFAKRTSKMPALLTHSNVVTLMHELGHVFHNLCAVTKWACFHGTRVERDFVETPSKMLENWAWEPQVLSKLSAHYKTGEPIPDSMIKKIIATKNDNAGLTNLLRVFRGLYDLSIHSISNGNVDVNDHYNSLERDITLVGSGNTGTFGVATFSHLMNRYDSKYYGYLWSQSFSADMFATRFQKEGINNTKTGMDYRNEILRPGGSRDAMESLEKFLGRKPNNDAFLKSIGL
ncbi:zincin [Coemansia reversa NRRL 1564]|uniref:Zincin n=1 Tax=Coemansia reversa (strain ATCC 12441 / NRRL 1564) TaxID=763665 RepID=A0A2G5BGV5_COERN|nr:zincin [Coemansia reversa NRRL 1564]|eukprot:PIA18249.1 zincin [Coemansia reversa NRRL 1564]